MTLSRFLDWFSDREERPNKFTIYLGSAIKKAREDAGMSQEELAKNIYRRRSSLSEYESGKTEPDAGTLCLLAYYLEKPISYFLPPFMYQEIKQESLSPTENALLIQFRKIWDEYLQSVAIKQVKILADFDPTEMIWDMIDITVSDKEREAQIRRYIEDRKRKRKS